MGAALARWKLGVADSPYNEGLSPKKFLFYDRYHYYQASRRRAGTGWPGGDGSGRRTVGTRAGMSALA